LNNIRILIVDDDHDARSVAVRVLREFQAEIADASNVEQALALLESFSPQILISDIGMPIRDGYDLIRTVRDRGYDGTRLPAIALTAFARGEDRVRVLEEGYQHHLGKPFAPRELVSAIARLVQPLS
jgi:CheY-like chemotaxis protein